MSLTSPALLLLLLASGCAAKSCQRADVDRSSSGSWSFDLDGCTSLKLRGTKIGDAGAKALAEALKTNGELTTLHLGHNGIEAEGAAALAAAPALRRLLLTDAKRLNDAVMQTIGGTCAQLRVGRRRGHTWARSTSSYLTNCLRARVWCSARELTAPCWHSSRACL